jgi:hypothetical protein
MQTLIQIRQSVRKNRKELEKVIWKTEGKTNFINQLKPDLL